MSTQLRSEDTMRYAIALAAILFFGCGDIDDTVNSVSSAASSNCLPSKTINWKYRSGDNLPLGQSRPGANVTLFVDFDGGSFSGVSSGKVSSNYDSGERAAIEDAIEQVAGNYWRWSINVTTDKAVFDKASKRGRLFVTTAKSRSGMASTNGISSSSRHTAYAGVDAVMNPRSSEKCAYLITHEFGHNFRLRGTTEDYADMYPSAKIGAFMGGRDSQFSGYKWIALENKNGDWQDPDKYIGRIAGYSGGGGGSGGGTGNASCSGRCSSSCKCQVNEGDCDVNTDCAAGLFCKQRRGTDYCQKSQGASSCDGRCSSSCRCDVGEGDCDRHRDCKPGLYCRQRRGVDYCRKR